MLIVTRTTAAACLILVSVFAVACGDLDHALHGPAGEDGPADAGYHDDAGDIRDIDDTTGPYAEDDEGRDESDGSSDECAPEKFADHVPDQLLTIRVRNLTDEIQYIGNPLDVVMSGPGVVSHRVESDELSFNRIYASCEEVLQGTVCLAHGDPFPMVYALAPREEFERRWSGTVFRLNTIGTACGLEYPCTCPQAVEPPAGIYLVGIIHSRELDCLGVECDCESVDGYCSMGGPVVAGGSWITAEVNWPGQTEVVLEIE